MAPIASRLISILLLISGIITAKNSYSAADTSSSVIPSSGDAIKAGDNIIWITDAHIFTLPPTHSGNPSQVVPPSTQDTQSTVFCAPAGSRFEVERITSAASKATAATTSQNPAPADEQIVVGSFRSGSSFVHQQAIADGNKLTSNHSRWSALTSLFRHKATSQADNASSTPTSKSPCNTDQRPSVVAYDTTYQFTSEDFKTVRSQREGWTWGGLIIPYKFYFTDRSFKANPSTVVFVGYEGWFTGISLSGVIAAGPGTTSSSNSNTTTSTKPASPTTTSSTTNVTYTFATGFIAAFGNSVKAGLMFGRDWQGSGTGFKYENKTWMALSIGTSF